MNSSNQSEMSEHEKSITMEPKNAEEDMERQKEKVESDDDSDDSDDEEEARKIAEEKARKERHAKKKMEKKKKKAKEELEAEMIEEFKDEDERLKWLESNLANVDGWRIELNQINVKKQTVRREKEKRHQTEHEIAVDDAVTTIGRIPNHIWDKVLKNPTYGIQLSCHKGVPIEFYGPVPFLKDMLENSKGQMTDLSLKSVLRHDDQTQSDIVRTKAGLQHIIKQLYDAPTSCMQTHVKVRKLT
jgi:hypothetical protein